MNKQYLINSRSVTHGRLVELVVVDIAKKRAGGTAT
jgi:hypothetical protein